ncbi:hypothetical protein FOZ63_011811, partial [Perkinsus olseni]
AILFERLLRTVGYRTIWLRSDAEWERLISQPNTQREIQNRVQLFMLKRFLKGSGNGKSRSHRHAPGNAPSPHDTPNRLSVSGQSSSLGAASPHRDSTRSDKHSGVDGFMGFLKSTLGRQRRSQQASSARRSIPDHDEEEEAASTFLTASPGYSEFSHVQDAEDILAPSNVMGAGRQ